MYVEQRMVNFTFRLPFSNSLVGGHHYRVRHCGEELDDLRQKVR